MSTNLTIFNNHLRKSSVQLVVVSLIFSIFSPLIFTSNVTATGTLDPLSTGTSAHLYDIRYTPSGSYALIVGDGGVALRYDGVSFNSLSSGTSSALYQISWKPDGSYALIGGLSGTVLKYDGSSFTSLSSGTSSWLEGVAWRPQGDYALLAGQGGTVLKYNGASFTPLSSGTSADIYELNWRPQGDYALLVGTDGTVLKYTHSTGGFSSISSGTTDVLYGIGWKPDGSYATILNFFGGDLFKYTHSTGSISSSTFPNKGCNDIDWKSDGSMALISAEDGWVYEYDGNSQSGINCGSAWTLWAVMFKPGSDTGIVVGNFGSAYKYSSQSTGPELSYSPSSLDFGTVPPGYTSSKTFEIWNSGDGSLSYTLSESASWISSINPPSGTSSGEHDTITVSIDTTGLADGSYNHPISINSNDGSGSVTIYVTVEESATPTPLLSYSPGTLNFGTMNQGSSTSRTFEIWNAGSGTLTYSLSESASWISSSPSSGTSSGEHDTITVSIDTAGINAGTYNHAISITTNDGSGSVTIYITVGPASSGELNIVSIDSYYQNFFVEGIEISNEFFATIQSSNPINSVTFSISGGSPKIDTNGQDGWSASFQMENVNVGDILTVTAETQTSSASKTYPLNVVSCPNWMQTFLDLGVASFHKLTTLQVRNQWRFSVELHIPADPIEVGFTVPDWIPLFSGRYEFGYFFVMGFEIRSVGTITVDGGGGFSTTIMSKKSEFTVTLGGVWRLSGNTIVWDSAIVSVSGEVQIPVFTRQVRIKITDTLTVVDGNIEFSIVPQAEIEFVLSPNGGFQIISGIYVSEIRGSVGIGFEGEGELTILNVNVGRVTGGASATFGFSPSQSWLDSVSLSAYFHFELFSINFEVQGTWDWIIESTKSGTRANGYPDLNWDIIDISGNSNPQIENYTGDSLNISVEKLTEEVEESMLSPPTNLTYRYEGGCPYLSWNPVSESSGYNIYRSNIDGEFVKINTRLIQIPSYFDNQIPTNLTGQIYYHVRAVSSEEIESLPSNTILINFEGGIPQDGRAQEETPTPELIIIIGTIGAIAICALTVRYWRNKKRREGKN